MSLDASMAKLALIDPITGGVRGEIACGSAEDVNAAVGRARAAQPGWANLPLKQRLNVLRRFRDLLYAQSEEIAALISTETGKPRVEALLTEIVVVLDSIGFLLREVPRLLQPEHVAHSNPVMKSRRSFLVREPFGVIGIISPWNYPLSTPAIETLGALMTGNTVVLKPSEFTPQVALRLKAMLEAVGLPNGVMEVVTGEGSTGSALSLATVDKLIFTGSVSTGKKIAAAAAKNLVPVILELGGKDPMIVLEDADIDVASSAAIWGAFMNAGQTCLSVERCYVHQRIFEAFVERCVEKTRKVKVGSPTDPESEVGPLISMQQLRTVESHLEDAVARGAKVRTGGKRITELGPTFFSPTVLTEVDHTMRVMREETFGPLLPIMPFGSETEAITLANDSDFGLSASVWTRDRKRGEAIGRKLAAGTVMVNDVISGFGICEAPHGGVKQSGIGRTHGRPGLQEMVRLKYVDSDRLGGIKKVWWYGYGSDFASRMQGFLDLLFAHSYRRRIAGGLRSVGALRRANRI